MVKPQPQEGYVTLQGVRFHYLDWGGTAPVLLCIHGANGNAHNWDWLGEALHSQLRVVAMDLRGHGLSDYPPTGHAPSEMAEDVAAFTEALQFEQFDLLGHSMGARIAAIYAARMPPRLRRLVLSEPPYYPVTDDLARAAAPLPEHEPPQRSSPRGQGPSAEDLLEAMKFLLGDLGRYLSHISCPTLLLRGEQSHLLSQEASQQMAASLPSCKLVEIPDAGHGLWCENPDAALRALREFLLAAQQ